MIVAPRRSTPPCSSSRRSAARRRQSPSRGLGAARSNVSCSVCSTCSNGSNGSNAMENESASQQYFGLVEMVFSFGVVLAVAFWQLRSIRKAREKLREKDEPPKQ